MKSGTPPYHCSSLQHRGQNTCPPTTNKNDPASFTYASAASCTFKAWMMAGRLSARSMSRLSLRFAQLSHHGTCGLSWPSAAHSAIPSSNHSSRAIRSVTTKTTFQTFLAHNERRCGLHRPRSESWSVALAWTYSELNRPTSPLSLLPVDAHESKPDLNAGMLAVSYSG